MSRSVLVTPLGQQLNCMHQVQAAQFIQQVQALRCTRVTQAVDVTTCSGGCNETSCQQAIQETTCSSDTSCKGCHLMSGEDDILKDAP
jgi:hypothetical protein